MLREVAVSDGDLKRQKTGRAYRTVDLPEPLAEDVAVWVDASGLRSADMLFVREKGGPWMRDVATDLASRVPKLGGHVATVDLPPGSGICIAKTAGPAHWSVWGRPLHLAGCAVEVVDVGS